MCTLWIAESNTQLDSRSESLHVCTMWIAEGNAQLGSSGLDVVKIIRSESLCVYYVKGG